MTRTTILMTSIIAMTFIVLTTSPAYAQVTDFYWSEIDGTGEIFTADSATKTISQVTSGGFITINDVEIDPLTNSIWWNNWSSVGRNSWEPHVPGGPSDGIYKSDIDGTGQVQVTNGTQSTSTNGFARALKGIELDPSNQKVFFTRGDGSWVIGYGGEVSSVNMDGTGYTMINDIFDNWQSEGIAFDISSNTLYWGDPGYVDLPLFSGAVNSIDSDGNKAILVPHSTGNGRSLAVDAVNELVFYSAHHSYNNGGEIIMYGGGIIVHDLNAGTTTGILIAPHTGIPDIELDTANMRIYWTDYTNGQIDSASYDVAGNLGTITTELSGLTNPLGLALGFKTTIPVEIDIKPESEPSSWNCKTANKGGVPVAVFSTVNFDASTIDLTSLTIEGIPVTEVHDKIHLEDNNGLDDAILHLDSVAVCKAASDIPLKETGFITLAGSTPLQDFEGIGDIRIVKR